MRNIPVALTPEDLVRVKRFKAHLASTVGREDVSLSYVKRDGSKGSSTGEVVEFKGTEGTDTMSVVVDCPDKGRRTINLSRITNIL